MWTKNCHKAEKAHADSVGTATYSELLTTENVSALQARWNGHVRSVSDARAVNQRQLRPAVNRGSPQNAKTYQILKFIWPDQAIPAQGNKSTVVYNSYICHVY